VGEPHLMIPVSDLSCLEITCPRQDCEAIVSFEVGPAKSRGTPERCPICGEPWTSRANMAFQNALQGYMSFFAFFGDRDNKMKPHFRTKEQENT